MPATDVQALAGRFLACIFVQDSCQPGAAAKFLFGTTGMAIGVARVARAEQRLDGFIMIHDRPLLNADRVEVLE